MNATPVSEYDDNEIVNPSANPHIASLLEARLSRRSTLKGGIGATTAALLGGLSLSACGGDGDDDVAPASLKFAAVAKTNADKVTVPEGYQVSILHALGDPMQFGDTSWSDKGTESPESYDRRIGDGHDGMYFFGMTEDGKFDAKRSDRGLLCVNHEYVVEPYGLHPTGATNRSATAGPRPASEVEKEIRAHGASIVEVKRKAGSNDMEMVRGSRYNRRVTSATPMDIGGPAAGNAKLVNKLSPDGRQAFGMNNNCANGYTPWGTYLTCEENFLNVIGRAAGDNAKRSAAEIVALNRYGLPENRNNPYRWDSPEGEQYARWNSKVSGATAADDHRNSFNTFGWVVEIDPFRPDSKPVKRTALGRFNHEGAWPAPARAGESIVIYSGDDARNEYVYKYVSDAKWDPADINGGTAVGAKYLDKGTLYVGKFNNDGSGEWLELTHGRNGIDAGNALYPFADQADVVMHCRLAADFRGATKMDRPEWGGVNPLNHEVYMTMTNNSDRKAPGSTLTGRQSTPDAANPRVSNTNGHIIRWKEEGSQAGTRFQWDIYLFGARVDEKQSQNLSGLTAVNDFSSPDGLHFDQRSDNAGGLLWIQTDDGSYTDVTNCMMLAALPGKVGDGGKVTTKDGQATIMGAKPTDATVRRFLVGPFDCEITGVVVTPDGKTLFFNVQHPGEAAANFATDTYTSHWPGNQAPASDTAHSGHKRPRSATVVVTRTDGGVIAI